MVQKPSSHIASQHWHLPTWEPTQLSTQSIHLCDDLREGRSSLPAPGLSSACWERGHGNMSESARCDGFMLEYLKDFSERQSIKAVLEAPAL